MIHDTAHDFAPLRWRRWISSYAFAFGLIELFFCFGFEGTYFDLFSCSANEKKNKWILCCISCNLEYTLLRFVDRNFSYQLFANGATCKLQRIEVYCWSHGYDLHISYCPVWDFNKKPIEIRWNSCKSVFVCSLYNAREWLSVCRFYVEWKSLIGFVRKGN